VESVTFRVSPGKCVLIGGLAQVEVAGDSKPFFLTFFVSNDIKLHPTDVSRADDYIRRYVGTTLTPTLGDYERWKELGLFDDHLLSIQGVGWNEAAADIALMGLGWVAVTGAGTATIRVRVPKGIGVSVRPPIMPYDVWETTARYTGNRAVRKQARSVNGKRSKGVGRR
jgi:hypothetical protein